MIARGRHKDGKLCVKVVKPLVLGIYVLVKKNIVNVDRLPRYNKSEIDVSVQVSFYKYTNLKQEFVMFWSHHHYLKLVFHSWM